MEFHGIQSMIGYFEKIKFISKFSVEQSGDIVLMSIIGIVFLLCGISKKIWQLKIYRLGFLIFIAIPILFMMIGIYCAATVEIPLDIFSEPSNFSPNQTVLSHTMN
jgi:hypothetical protein